MINEGWGLVSQLGLWGWIGCTIGLIMSTFPRRELFLTAKARLWGTGVVLLFATWVLGMIKA